MKKKFLLPLICLLAFSLSACGTKGDTGPQGEQGIPGENGQDGQNGVDGKDGTSVRTGNGTPSNTLGQDGDSYIDLDTWDYYVKENGSWVLKGNIKGQDGQDAIQYIPAIFNNYDGSMLYTFYYEKGSDIVYDGPEPTREGYILDGEQYIYEFNGWDKSLENIQVPTIFTAQYSVRNLTREYNIAHGITPVYDSSTQTATYGLYPQTNVNDSDLISELNKLTATESNGWYLHEGEYYAKASATPFISGYKFDNGTTIVSGETYWFKCEPITWNVLSNNDGEYYLLSSVLLDAHCYYNSTSNRTIDEQTVYPNNYEYSDIRAWLNNDFYNSAFALNNSNIQILAVDNSAPTTDSSDNSFVCRNTEDKVFLPSYQDYINSSYGFDTSTDSTDTRYCKTTDWARARGAHYYADSGSNQYSGYYWTRSPSSGYSDDAWFVRYDGCLDYEDVSDTDVGVRPAITINL